MDYSLYILILPFLSFIIIGLLGKWMSHKTAGITGTISLAIVTVLSFAVALSYFSSPRTSEGVYPVLIPYNFP